MGTNYYLPSDGRHIGKQSAGWRFLAQAETAPNWDSLVDLVTVEGIVVDEYEGGHFPHAFFQRVELAAHRRRHVTVEGRVIYSDGPADFYRGEFS